MKRNSNYKKLEIKNRNRNTKNRNRKIEKSKAKIKKDCRIEEEKRVLRFKDTEQKRICITGNLLDYYVLIGSFLYIFLGDIFLGDIVLRDIFLGDIFIGTIFIGSALKT